MRLPELVGGEYLIDALLTAGPTTSSGMGEGPLDWLTIDAFARCTGDLTEQWELKALHRMSRIYLTEREAGKAMFRKAPVDR